MSQLLHLTVGYPRTADMELLERSSRAHGFAFRALPMHWNALKVQKIQKLSVLRAFIESGEVPLDAVVLFTDAYDVLALCDASILEERFRRSGADIVFSAEVNFFPKDDRDPRTQALFETYPSKWRYLNSGCYIGFAWAVLEMLKYTISIWGPTSRSDQMLTQEFYRRCIEVGDVRVHLDTVPEFFGSLNASYNDFTLRGPYAYGPNSPLPVPVLHCNGDKDNLRILRNLDTLFLDPPAAFWLDLRVLRLGGELVRYDPAAQRLVRAKGEFDHVVFVVCHANARAVFFTARHGALSFTPGGSVETGREAVRTWETVATRGTMTTTHKRPISEHFTKPPAGALTLEHFVLTTMREAGFPAVVAHARTIATQLVAVPDLGAGVVGAPEPAPATAPKSLVATA